MIAEIVYIIGALVMFLCGILLLRGYFRGRHRLLLWSALCFFGLSGSNLLIFVDLRILPEVDLYPARLATAAIAMILLLYGLIWEGD
ncbi:MAG TPA: DUF5985 family protein [Terriglobales bacterium]|nr:DUF5985 family protein [Terriglobales bacterium]